MIVGIGVDMVEIARIEKCINRHSRFLDKYFSEEEIIIIKRNKNLATTAAGRFAAKEAVAKALGTGLRAMKLRDIVIDRNDLGNPVVILKGGAQKVAEGKNINRVHVSISHTAVHATAFAIAES